jgi:aspartyl-tRNA(Asn)/glutamyl-tRNA(Gln) amidotransferase subunit A
VHPDVTAVVSRAADLLIDATGMTRVDVDVRVPEKAAAWANAGAPGLFNDLKDVWPDCADDLTYEIRAGMMFMDRYRVWHAASVDRFRVEMNEALADIFERTDILLCATNPVEPFAAEGPMPAMVGDVRVGRQNNGALTIPGNIAGYPAISIPAGLSANGLPIGLQAYARRHEDALLLDLALAVERAQPWPLVAPDAPV